MSTGEDPKQARQSVHFLIEQAHQEVANFWTRMNVFLAINSGGVAAVAAWLTSDHPPPFGVVTIFIVASGLFCCIWLVVIKMSQYYGDRWLRDARRIAEGLADMRQELFVSLGFRELEQYQNPPQNWFGDPFFDLRRPRLYGVLRIVLIRIFGKRAPNFVPGTADCMYGVVGLFMLSWLALGILAKVIDQ